MKGALGIAAAGGTFAATVIVALLIGIWLGGSHHQEYVLIALLAGLVVGGYAAYRLIAEALRL
jgi:hypothetical protein